MVISDSPGLKLKANGDGTSRAYWEARSDLVKRGYRPSSVRLHYPETPDGITQRSARCRILWAEMLSWAANDGSLPKRGYDGSIGSLCTEFQTHEASPYRTAKWNTQRLYDGCIKIIKSTVGARRVGDVVGPDLLRWHSNWALPVAPGSATPNEGKALHGYRATELHRSRRHARVLTDASLRLILTLGKMRFQKRRSSEKWNIDTSRTSRLVRTTARKLGLGSVCFGYRHFQFELTLRQKDVGEWEAPFEGTAEGGIVQQSNKVEQAG